MSLHYESKLLDVLLSNTSQVFFIQDAFTDNLDFIYVNKAYETLFGNSRQSLLDNSRSYLESIHPDDIEEVASLYKEFIEGNLAYEKDFVFRIIRSDGDVRWIYTKAWAIFNSDGEVYRLAGVAEDITRRKESEISINRLNEVQSGVIKMLAHDLRTPIAGIKLTASLLAGSSKENVKKCSDHIIDSCNNTLLMMDDLLSHIRMTGEGVYMNTSRLIIEEELNSICKELNIQFKKKNLSLKLPSTSTVLELDSVKFSQIVINLLTNAIKFSYIGGVVSLRIEDKPSTVDLVVKDEGVGISKESLPEVFDIFTRARKVGTNGESSTGIGLSITKRLVELHNGKISIKSKPNNGTDVRVSFPK